MIVIRSIVFGNLGLQFLHFETIYGIRAVAVVIIVDSHIPDNHVLFCFFLFLLNICCKGDVCLEIGRIYLYGSIGKIVLMWFFM